MGAFDPFQRLGIDIKRARLEIDPGIVIGEVPQWRQRSVLERQARLYQANDAGRGPQMADIAFDRSQSAISPLCCIAAVDVGYRRDLNRITEKRCRAMGLEVAD